MESINNVKEWMVQAEDQKQNNNYSTMISMYSSVLAENKTMINSLE